MAKSGPLLHPNLSVSDPVAAYWLAQAGVCLRLELLWLRQARGHGGRLGKEYLPAFSDRVSENLSQVSYWEGKQAFFLKDPSAKYLLEFLERPVPVEPASSGPFARIQAELELKPVACFVLALALLPVYDSAVGPAIASCLNDEQCQQPNLALAQRLWRKPDEVLTLLEPNHVLFRYGLIQLESSQLWTRPLLVAPQIARILICGKGDAPLLALRHDAATVTLNIRTSVARAKHQNHLRILPLLAAGSVREELVVALEGEMGRPVKRYGGAPSLLNAPSYFYSLLTLCWLLGADLFLDEHAAGTVLPHLGHSGLPVGLDLTLYLACKTQNAELPAHLTLPPLEDKRLGYQDRVALWCKYLGPRAAELGPSLDDVARRFRYPATTIEELCHGLHFLEEPLTEEVLVNSCRARFQPKLGETAQQIQPRFGWEDLVLPHKQRRMCAEIDRAMRNLTQVHYQWGTADVWNESGISVLFAGPPGTGKTMAAEVLARSLNMPLYRIDLSQLVSKYIGETEKNLATVFDAADEVDLILLFDEADALFGRRTDVKDAHDRYANIEVSYLLQRMESFRGMAILATNRKKDLDEAFQRRLRYSVDFPLPGEAQRALIWEKTLPKAVRRQDLDLDFLARQFPLSGGHIRSIVFNACLQAASLTGDAPALTMSHLVNAVSREYNKLDREIKSSHFGAYAALLEEDGD